MRHVNCYSKKDEGGTAITNHFRVSEFACKDGEDTVFIDLELVKILENIRTHFNKPVYVNSGYRTPSHNKTVGGAQYSYHKRGQAADIHINGVKPSTVAAYARQIMPYTGGIGIYDTFVHIDTRAVKTTWNG